MTRASGPVMKAAQVSVSCGGVGGMWLGASRNISSLNDL